VTPSDEKSTKIKILHGQKLEFFKKIFGILELFDFLHNIRNVGR